MIPGKCVLTLEEESCLVGNQVTSKVLRRVNQAGNNCPSQVSALEKIKKCGSTAHLFLDLNGTLHHGKCVC